MHRGGHRSTAAANVGWLTQWQAPSLQAAVTARRPGAGPLWHAPAPFPSPAHGHGRGRGPAAGAKARRPGDAGSRGRSWWHRRRPPARTRRGPKHWHRDPGPVSMHSLALVTSAICVRRGSGFRCRARASCVQVGNRNARAFDSKFGVHLGMIGRGRAHSSYKPEHGQRGRAQFLRACC